jgi:hypothetical protein
MVVVVVVVVVACGTRAARAVEAREYVTGLGLAVAGRCEVGLILAAPSSSRPRTLPRPRSNNVILALSMACSSSRSVRARITWVRLV